MALNPLEKEAARAGLSRINPTSIRENVEYFFLVFQISGKFKTTEPVTSRLADGICEDDVNLSFLKVAPGGIVTAMAHTHGRDVQGPLSMHFSPEDIQLARNKQCNAYLATPTNELVMWDHTYDHDEFPREKLDLISDFTPQPFRYA